MNTLITIGGKVTDAASNDPLTGVKVVARQEGTEIQQETDSEGKFRLNVIPGLWRITVWAKGFIEPDTYMYNFTSDTNGIDFELKEGYSISGQVISEENSKPAMGVIVETETTIDNKHVVRQELTDRNGKYRFSGLPSGQWQVQGSRGERQTGKEDLSIGPDAFNLNLTLARQMTPVDWRWGTAFFGALCVLLVLLIGIYLQAHRLYVTGPVPEMAAFTEQVDQTEKLAADLKGRSSVTDQELQGLRSSIASIKEYWNSVSNSMTTSGQNAQVALFLSRAETAGSANNPAEVDIALNGLKTVIKNWPSSYFWSQSPANYLEALFWSLAGITVSLLITTGYYLRRKRFYAEGTWMHLSHLLSVPLLALVVVFLLSQVKLTLQLDQSEVAIDINDPRLLAALSFIIAVRPWAILEFVREAASRFFRQAQSRIGGGSETRSEPGTT